MTLVGRSNVNALTIVQTRLIHTLINFPLTKASRIARFADALETIDRILTRLGTRLGTLVSRALIHIQFTVYSVKAEGTLAGVDCAKVGARGIMLARSRRAMID